ncbi:hypothetical protein CFIO01_06591 [Colletotrichum fioriniae PJ7]|uniref:Uncharacterized protein n=1 Tax=Colletotrichum fioriniae PJ7 TaxID=1445577 RepID=A0A010QWL7_9PEZI|nr:hypothetical protein CFIO01_06591 [Colletotrichum fioriniae PJ7]
MLDGWDIWRLQMARSNFSSVDLSVPSVTALVWGWKTGGDWGTPDWGETVTRRNVASPPHPPVVDTNNLNPRLRRKKPRRPTRLCGAHGVTVHIELVKELVTSPFTPSSPAADWLLASSPDTCKKRTTDCPTVTSTRSYPSTHIRSMFRSQRTRQVGHCPALRPCVHTEVGWRRAVEVSEQTAPPMSEEVVEAPEE